MNVPPLVARYLNPKPTLHLKRTSKILYFGGPDTGKTTHAKRVAHHYPRSVVWDPGHEWKPGFCARNGWRIARTLDHLEIAARQSRRVVLQPLKYRRASGITLKDYEKDRAELGDAFCWWVLENLRGPAFVYLDEPHTIMDKDDLPGGLAELLRRGHKEDNDLAMAWSAWGARELPNDLENVSHLVVFRSIERNDLKRMTNYFGKGWDSVVKQLPAYFHAVRQEHPVTRQMLYEVHPPVKL